MNDFEQAFCQMIVTCGLRYEDYTMSGNHPDVKVHRKNGKHLWVELKEKRQRINTASWPKTDIPEKHLFILDELTARKLLFYAPDAAVVVLDHTRNTFYFVDVIDLWLMPRVRANRPMETSRGDIIYKGKWLLNLRNFVPHDNLRSVVNSLSNFSDILLDKVHQNECLSYFEDDPISLGGELRTEAHKRMDW